MHELVQRAHAAEPTITSVLERVATDVGATLDGGRHRFKKEARMREKASVNDALRYTLILPFVRYTDEVKRVVATLRKRADMGHKLFLTRPKTLWSRL